MEKIGIDGNKFGSQIMIHSDSYRDGTGWYVIKTENHPFYYVSPPYLYSKPLTMKKAEKFSLDYKILHLAGEADLNKLKTEYNNYIYH